MNINKNHKRVFIITVIFLSVITLFPSYGLSDNDILTFENALEISSRNNNDLRKISNQGRKASEKGERLSYELDFYSPNHDPFGQEFAYFASQAKSINFEQELAARNTVMVRENIKIQLIAAFNNIDKINNELNLLDKKIFREQERQRLESIKKDLGVTSGFELKTGENKFNSLVKSKYEKEQELRKAYLDLSKIMNTTIESKTKIQPLSFKFEPLNQDKAKLDFHATRAIENNIVVWSKEKEIDFKKLELDLFAISVTPFSTGASIGNEPYNIKEIDKSMLSNDLQELKTNARKAVIDKYNSIQTIETSISSLYQQRKSLLDEIEMMKVRTKLGLVTNEPIKDMELQIKELENTIFELERQHEYLKLVYLNPFLASM